MVFYYSILNRLKHEGPQDHILEKHVLQQDTKKGKNTGEKINSVT